MEVEFFTSFLNKHPFELYNDEESAERKKMAKEQTAFQSQIKQLDKDIERVVNLMGEFPRMSELKKKLRRLNDERETLKKSLDALNAQLVALRSAPKALRQVLSYEIDLDTGEHSNIGYADTYERTLEALADNKERERIRTLLPALLGKITVDAMKGRFYVYNRMGKVIFTSVAQKSNRNSSVTWKQSLKRK